MDEPLSNLDAKLRVAMRGDIRALQRKVGITTIYVTHDQEEALAISDRIAVMDAGLVQQIGKPAEVYVHPVNQFVADFVGATNMLNARLVKHEVEAQRAWFDCGLGSQWQASARHRAARRSMRARGATRVVVVCQRGERGGESRQRSDCRRNLWRLDDSLSGASRKRSNALGSRPQPRAVRDSTIGRAGATRVRSCARPRVRRRRAWQLMRFLCAA